MNYTTKPHFEIVNYILKKSIVYASSLFFLGALWLDHPLIFIQVTRFQCGGLCIGIAFSHQAMDGTSAWRFISCWAKLTRSGLDRSSLSPKELPGPFYSYRDPEASAMDRDEIVQAGAGAGFVPLDPSAPDIPLETKLVSKMFTLDRAAIERLKTEAGTASDGKGFTTYEAVCADFWKKMTKARLLPPGSATNFILLVSTRGKVSSIPDSYFGNAVFHFLVSATAEEIDREPVGHAAELIHRGILAATASEERIRKSIAFMDREIRSLLRYKVYPFQIVVSSPRHPVMECDFGFGRPIWSSFGTNDLHEGKIYLFPSPVVEGGIDVTVVLQPDAILRLIA